MRLTSKWMVWLSAALMLILGIGVHAPEAGAISVGIVCADPSPPTSELMGTGLFTGVTVLGNITPTLAVLKSYDAILAYSNYLYTDPTSLGNVLADYVDGGGGLVLATFSFTSGGWAVGGRITTSGYAPLEEAAADYVGGTLTAVVPGDPIFAGVNLADLFYYTGYYFPHPELDPGATLLAKDASDYNMIARNSNGLVIGMNLFPASGYGNNGEFYELLGNSLVSVANPVPLPGAVWLLGSGLLGLVGWRRLRKG